MSKLGVSEAISQNRKPDRYDWYYEMFRCINFTIFMAFIALIFWLTSCSKPVGKNEFGQRFMVCKNFCDQDKMVFFDSNLCICKSISEVERKLFFHYSSDKDEK